MPTSSNPSRSLERSPGQRPHLGLQLYTLRHRLEEDVEDALDCAAGAGYEGLELFGGWWGGSPQSWKRSLSSRGLRCLAAHVDLATLQDTPPAELGEAFAEVGCDRLILPWVDPEVRRTVSDYRSLGRRLDGFGYSLKARSIHLGYHNHEFEFDVEGEDGLAALTSQLSHPGMFVELDVFWAAWAGKDPVRLIRNFGKRLRMLHLKDGRLAGPGTNPDDAEILPAGTGDLPMIEILKAACEVGVEAVFVELDRFPGGPGDGNDQRAIRESREFIESVFRQVKGQVTA